MNLLLNDILMDDLYRYEGGNNKKLSIQIRYLLTVPEFLYTVFYRKSNSARLKVTRMIWSFFLNITKVITHIRISSAVKIGRGLRIAHFGSIVVNPHVVIGKNFNISEGCLIGFSEGRNRGVPTIGDNVCMNANAIIIGGVHIGNNVLIAPGAFINFDVPDNSIVIGNPGKIINRETSPTAKFIVYPVD